MENDSSVSDQELLTKIQQGSANAFAILVKRHSQRFYRLAYVMTYNQSVAQDIVQDAFLKLWEKPYLWDITKNSQFSTWFYRLVLNLCYDYHKKSKEVLDNDIAAKLADTDSPETYAISLEQDNLVKQLLSTLPHRQKAAVNLCYFELLSQKQAAEVLGVSVSALQALLARAKLKAKQDLADLLAAGGQDGYSK